MILLDLDNNVSRLPLDCAVVLESMMSCYFELWSLTSECRTYEDG